MKLIRALRLGISYSKAGNAMDRGDYNEAYALINKTKSIIGDDIHRSSMFEVYMRAAWIAHRLDHTQEALDSLFHASTLIKSHKHFSDLDRAYLLDYCDVFASRISGDGAITSSRLSLDEHENVTPRYRRYYPLHR